LGGEAKLCVVSGFCFLGFGFGFGGGGMSARSLGWGWWMGVLVGMVLGTGGLCLGTGFLIALVGTSSLLGLVLVELERRSRMRNCMAWLLMGWYRLKVSVTLVWSQSLRQTMCLSCGGVMTEAWAWCARVLKMTSQNASRR
jgi:hypothetical protein